MVLKESVGMSVRRDLLAAIELKLPVKGSNNSQLEGIQSFFNHNKTKTANKNNLCLFWVFTPKIKSINPCILD